MPATPKRRGRRRAFGIVAPVAGSVLINALGLGTLGYNMYENKKEMKDFNKAVKKFNDRTKEFNQKQRNAKAWIDAGEKIKRKFLRQMTYLAKKKKELNSYTKLQQVPMTKEERQENWRNLQESKLYVKVQELKREQEKAAVDKKQLEQFVSNSTKEIQSQKVEIKKLSNALKKYYTRLEQNKTKLAKSNRELKSLKELIRDPRVGLEKLTMRMNTDFSEKLTAANAKQQKLKEEKERLSEGIRILEDNLKSNNKKAEESEKKASQVFGQFQKLQEETKELTASKLELLKRLDETWPCVGRTRQLCDSKCFWAGEKGCREINTKPLPKKALPALPKKQ